MNWTLHTDRVVGEEKERTPALPRLLAPCLCGNDHIVAGWSQEWGSRWLGGYCCLKCSRQGSPCADEQDRLTARRVLSWNLMNQVVVVTWPITLEEVEEVLTLRAQLLGVRALPTKGKLR